MRRHANIFALADEDALDSPPTLALDATPEEFRHLHDVLRELATDVMAFSSLFDPLLLHRLVSLRSRDTVDTLRRFGLVGGDSADGIVGLHRMRRRGDHFYVMELGGVIEYHQDIWPETDALLALVENAPPCSLLDMGTGCGIVGIEAASRGHRVVATDLYETALTLARFNAALNGFAGAIEYRTGHLFEPAGDDRFDLVLTAPHYTRVNDQLRLETLRTGPDVVAPGGRLVVATFLEWEADGAIPAVETLLRPLCARGFSVRVEPLAAHVKREWFSVAQGEAALGPLPSRHRFLVTVSPEADPAAARLELTRPAAADTVVQPYAPLTQLRVGAGPRATPSDGTAALAVIGGAEDIARLRELLRDLTTGLLTLRAPLPAGVLDGCRFGHRPCVSDTDASGAASAILDVDGTVRPCSRGDRIGRADDTMNGLLEHLRQLTTTTRERRGCAACVADPHCSHCLFPTPLDEPGYCDLIREHAAVLPDLARVFELLRYVSHAHPGSAQLRVKTRRTVPLLVAQGRPFPSPRAAHPFEDVVSAIAERMRDWKVWLMLVDNQTEIVYRSPSTQQTASSPTDRVSAEFVELIADGATATELNAYSQTRHLDADTTRRVVYSLAETFMIRFT